MRVDDGGRYVEYEVDQHHGAVLRLGLLRDDVLEKLDRTDRVEVLVAAMRQGFVRIRVHRSRDLAVHAEAWRWSDRERDALRRWARRRQLHRDHVAVVGTVGTGATIEATIEMIVTLLDGTGSTAAPPPS